MERAYTVSELNALRRIIENKWLFGTYDFNSVGNRWSRSYYENEKASCVEKLVRTHMLAGHTADDLIKSEKP